MKRGGNHAVITSRVVRGQTRDDSSKSGFTIIEVMIVLAVTGAMFVSAAMLISGRQAKTEFQVAVRTLQTEIQQVINEVKSGYYPAGQDFGCSTVGSGSLQISGSTTSQGTHSKCIFIGKVIALSDDMLYTYSLAGARQTSTMTDVKTYKEARATVIAPSDANHSAPNITETLKLPGGIKLVKAGSDGTLVSTSTFAFAILSSLNTFVSSGDASSGMQTYGVYGIVNPNILTSTAQSDIADAINDEFAYSSGGVDLGYPSYKQVQLCVQSGGTDQSALINVGSSVDEQSTAVSNTIKNGTTCS